MLSHLPAHAQQDQVESRRKIVNKVVPIYPFLAQKMGIAGSVRIEALVMPNGTVKSAVVLGGHPVLAQAALDAVRRCKWEAAPHETKEPVILNFHPE
jgi:TonB family protein